MKQVRVWSILLIISIFSCKKNDHPNVIFQDPLSVDKGTWSRISDVNSTRSFSNGAYDIRVVTYSWDEWSLAPTDPINFQYTAQVDAISLADDPTMVGATGIIFNYVDNNNHAGAEVYTNGYYRVWIKTLGTISNLKESDNVNISQGNGVKNTLKIVQLSETVEFFVNNSLIGNFAISLPNSSFKVGIFTGDPSSTPVTGEFNNFLLTRN